LQSGIHCSCGIHLNAPFRWARLHKVLDSMFPNHPDG
jgi:hypothetical protein